MAAQRQDKMYQYRCYYCLEESDVFPDIIQHLVKEHSSMHLKYRQLEINNITGGTGYRTKTFQHIVPDDGEVFITTDNRVGIYANTEKSKKAKLNTTTKLKQDVMVSEKNDDETQLDIEDNSMIGDCSEGVPDKSDEISQLMKCLPAVLQSLKDSGHLETYKKWCELIVEGKFPMENICFLLFLDIIDWYATSNTSKMRYIRPQTKQFWDVGYKLFKGKFIRFMSGPRNKGRIIDGSEERGSCSPSLSKMNFAVPSPSILNQNENTTVKPGIIEDTINSMSKYIPTRLIKIGVDGKKIARGKGKEMGDVDCWGYELEPTLKDRLKRFEDEQEAIKELLADIKDYDQSGKTTIPIATANRLSQRLSEMVTLISLRIRDLRKCIVKVNSGIEKFTALGDQIASHWTKSKFVPLISSLKVSKYDIERSIEQALRMVNSLCFTCACLNGTCHMYSEEGQVNIKDHWKYNQLKNNVIAKNPRFIKQKTDEWFEVRKNAKVTGSTCNTALGLGKLKDQQAHFDRVILKENSEVHFSDVQKKNMNYGSTHEIDGIATVVARILPSIYPSYNYFEEGCVKVENGDDKCFMVVSPDGSLREHKEDEPKMMYENKCKISNIYTTPVFYEIPRYYIPQVMSEMRAYGCKKLLLTCWSRESTTAFEISFNEDLWAIMWDELINVYGVSNAKRPARFSPRKQQMESLLKQFEKQNVKFIGEFPSCRVTSTPDSVVWNGGEPYISPLANDEPEEKEVLCETLLKHLYGLQQWHSDVYRLCRTSATEILVFMANDLDRKYHAEISNAHPIAYAMKGSSLPNEAFGKMLQHVIDKCEEYGLRVIATSSDGQWHKYGVRESNTRPLTVYQLQRDHWKSQKARSKSDILHEIRNLCKITSLDDVVISKRLNGSLMVHGHVHDRPLRVFKGTDLRKANQSKESHTILDETSGEREKLDVNDTVTLVETFGRGVELDDSFSKEVSGMKSKDTIKQNVMDSSYGVAMGNLFKSNESAKTTSHSTTNNDFDGQHSIQMKNSAETYTEEHQVQIEQPVQLDESYSRLLKKLQQKTNPRHELWAVSNSKLLCEIVTDKEKCLTHLQKNELILCIEELSDYRNIKITYFKSWNKSRLYDTLKEGFVVEAAENRVICKRKKSSPPKLAKIISNALNKFPKDKLAIVLAENKWNSTFTEWCAKCPFLECGMLKDSEIIRWFSVPSTVNNSSVRFHFDDNCHILTCLRTKICTTGIVGLQQRAWMEAAVSGETQLNIAIVKECVDKQSVPYAKRIFAEDVEEYMRTHGFETECTFVRLIRRWFEAEDCPGIPASERCDRRLQLREWLLKGINFGRFPPLTQYVKGIPITTYESLLVHLERKMQIYQFLPSRQYNPRALGTQEVEQFFSTIRDLDPCGQGTPKPDDIPDIIGTAAYLDNIRMNPDRCFFMKTSKAPVYPDYQMEDPDLHCAESGDLPCDSFFDTNMRNRVKKKRKSGLISSPSKPAHGQSGVRQYHKCDESKILPHLRKGLCDITM